MKDLSRFSLEDKVGQLFFLGFRGDEPDQDTRALLQTIRPGGIVVSQRNLSTFDQFGNLTRSFVQGPEVPAFVGISQEGGAVDKLRQLFAPLPSMSEVAALGITAMRTAARIIATQLESLGINTNFAPVLDLGTPQSFMRDRTFGSTSGTVTRFATAYLEEFSSRGVLPCPKHFPGLGAAERDPHFALPRIDKPKKLLLQEDVVPFMKIAPKVQMMMVGHGHYPGLAEGGNQSPACLSSRIVDGLLRRKLGFDGVIITDDMTMGAITRIGLTPDVFLEAIEAGADMVLFSETTPLVEKAFRLIVDSARRSNSLRARLDESLVRILSVKSAIKPPLQHRALMRTRAIRQVERLNRLIKTEPGRSPVAG